MEKTEYLLSEISKTINDGVSVKALSKDDEFMLGLYGEMAKAARSYIHGDLTVRGTTIAEKKIRDVLKKYIAPNLERIKARKESIENKSRGDHEIWARYTEMYIEFMSLLAFRSFKHFCLLLEEDFPRKIWEPTQHIFDGWYYYANKMVLDGTVTFIEKQLPTGYGKSVSDCFLIAWLFGIDINNDVIKVFGNKHNVSRCMETIAELMKSRLYARVFPYFEQFGGSNAMFDLFRTKDGGELKIHGSRQPINMICVGKDTTISGTRAKFLFLDDITQAEDKDIIRSHEKDISKYTDVWFKRSYSMNNFYVIAGGTTYSTFDLLSYLKRNFNFDEALPVKLNKYTRVAKSSEIKKDGLSVFISVPKLDYTTDESTYPLEFPTEKARRQRNEDYRTFMAMEQQQPLPPENTPFYYTNLREYETLPIVGELGRDGTCVAALDPKRRGADNVAMPICFEAQDYENPKETAFYLIDFLYDERPMKDCIPSICNKIIQHNITRLYAERNTEECIGKLIEDELARRGYNSCVIDDVFSIEPKDRRIMNAEGDIKRKIIFPKFGTYARANEVGRALDNVYSYSYKVKNKFDDAIDALALFAKRYIIQPKGTAFARAGTFTH